MELPLLPEIVILLGLSLVVLYLSHRIRLPAIVGLLLTGVLAGPHLFGFVKATHEVEAMAEVGVILLLFAVGIEFSLKKLWNIKNIILVGGGLQVGLTVLVTYLMVRQMNFAFSEAVFMGFLFALSSTAIVLKLYQDGGNINSPQGKAALAILIFQDIIIVPMMLLVPLLAGETSGEGAGLGWLLLKAAAIIAAVPILAQWVMPFVLYYVARTRSRELFILTVVAICFAVAWTTSMLNLSLALGAFLAGLIISESEYSHEAFSNILPFRDVFTSFFFVSIGMLLQVEYLTANILLVSSVTLLVLLTKTLVATGAAWMLGYPLRTALITGLSLCQVGEFAFILSTTGMQYELLSDANYQLFLSVSILSMGVTPFIFNWSGRIAEAAMRLPIPEKLKMGYAPTPKTEEAASRLHDHLVIIGFGINGRNLARVAKASGIPYAIIEMNPRTVRTEQRQGEPIYFGDATRPEVLERVHLKQARVAVVAISDPMSIRRTIRTIRHLNSDVFLIVRTRYVQEVDELLREGADEVIPEEFETSIEIFTRVLTKYMVPEREIEQFVTKVRAGSYGMLRSLSRKSPTMSDVKLHFSDLDIKTFRVANGAEAAGQTLSELDLRNRYGITLLVIRSGEKMISSPPGNTKIHSEDHLILFGPPDKMPEAARLFTEKETTDYADDTDK